MGVIKDNIKKAFDYFDIGDIERFVAIIANTADVRYGWHRRIVNNEIEKQLEKRNLTDTAGVTSKKKPKNSLKVLEGIVNDKLR